MSETLETEVWSKQDLNFQASFSSLRRQLTVPYGVSELISRSLSSSMFYIYVGCMPGAIERIVPEFRT
jgi:hypothetical protein